MLGTLGRYYVAYVVYDGATDAERYNLAAAFQYRSWREGVVTWDLATARGTQYMELITTAVYTVIGPTTLAAFFVYSAFAFWGVYLLYRAFRVALPDGDHRRYAYLVFLLPSMLYWPSSIGKEAWLHALRRRDRPGGREVLRPSARGAGPARGRRVRHRRDPSAHRRPAVRGAARRPAVPAGFDQGRRAC